MDRTRTRQKRTVDGTAEKQTFAFRLARMIVKKQKWIVSLFVIGCLFSLIAMFFVNVNYDLTEYLPGDAESRIGLEVMEREFGYPGTARVMLKDVSIYEAKQIKDQLAKVPGVDQILWCDSQVNLYGPESFMDQEAIQDYYKDGCAVMDITFEEADGASETKRALEEMEEIVGDQGCFVGMAVQNRSLAETLESEMNRILVVAVLMILFVLCISTTAWSEPVLFLLVMGVAILLNRGTNIFIGTISFMTNNVAIILQLATSMDYSIFLLDAFSRERERGASDETAIVTAIEEAINSIFASSLTTVVGFLALTSMKFTVGFDLGLVLAKGIVFSLITVVFFMPALIEECRLFPRNIFHVDGRGVLNHLDSILTLPNLQLIQWVFGAGNGAARDWIEVYRKCIAHDKAVQVYAGIDDLDALFAHLRPERTMLMLQGISTGDEAEYCMKRIRNWK